MKKHFIKRIITSIVIVFIILVAVRTVGAHFFEKGYAQNDELINGVVKLLLFFGTLYILKTEKINKLGIYSKEQDSDFGCLLSCNISFRTACIQ